jgi:hypothetical protein
MRQYLIGISNASAHSYHCPQQQKLEVTGDLRSSKRTCVGPSSPCRPAPNRLLLSGPTLWVPPEASPKNPCSPENQQARCQSVLALAPPFPSYACLCFMPLTNLPPTPSHAIVCQRRLPPCPGGPDGDPAHLITPYQLHLLHMLSVVTVAAGAAIAEYHHGPGGDFPHAPAL